VVSAEIYRQRVSEFVMYYSLEKNRQNFSEVAVLKNCISSVEKLFKADGSPLFAKSRFRQMASVYINFWTYTGFHIGFSSS
jgi:hypothetical protein